ncbi:LppU/SCO3897 family protein [Gordonia hongkongensis]|uniref:LppU/SCO3897 family protein n=2 Tax=Gordonia TaxID=2053 RepID=UPI003EBAAFA8
MPGGMYPPGPPFPPPQRKKKRTWLWVSLGVVGLVVFAVAGLGVHRLGESIPPSRVLTSSSHISIGECVQMEVRQGSLIPKRASCSGSEFRYVVVSMSTGRESCGPEYAKFWFSTKYPSAAGGLCLAEVLNLGSCYFLSAATEGVAIAETREIDCAEPIVVPGATNIRVDSKAEGKPTCPEGQSKYFIPKPTPTGYCLTFLE